MKANEAPEKLYFDVNNNLIGLYDSAILGMFSPKNTETSIEYTRTDAFIEKACEYLYNYNQKQVLKHGVRATLGLGEYTINVDDFRKYMKK